MEHESLKLTTYFAERLRSGDRFVADALLDLYGESAVATSVVLRGIASFGPHHELRSDQSLSTSEDSPIAIAAVDRADKIAPLADRAVAMTTRGLVTLERARLLVGTEAPRHAATRQPVKFRWIAIMLPPVACCNAVRMIISREEGPRRLKFR